MAISSNRYVDITSSVGGGDAVATRELMLRIFTTNELVPTGSVMSFSSSSLDSSLLNYFGSTSKEYLMAAYYFGFISKKNQSPKNIQFTRWADTDTGAQVFGSELPSLATLQAYTVSDFTLSLGGVEFNISGGDLSGASAYADIASLLQAAIQAEGGVLAAATVTYNSSTTAFDFDTNGANDGTILFTAVTPGLLGDLGWGENATYSDGVAAQTVTEVLAASTGLNNNYGSFDFIPDMTDEQILERAVWADGRNVEFMNLQRVQTTNRQSIYDAVNGYASTGLVLSPVATEYPELLPAALLASINFDKTGASKNFMYYQDSKLTESVSTDTEADVNDAISVNYMGQTQESGTNLTFFQKGVLTGGSTAPKSMGVHANEQWLKAYFKAQFLNMFLALDQVSADEAGQAVGLTYLDAGIAQALFNGSISVGKTLTTTQINYITQLTGSEDAYKDVASKGYWYELNVDATTEEMTYLLVYAKRDSVNFVDGSHSLI